MNISKGLFNKIWLGVIALCVIVSIFALFFSACSSAVEEADSGFEITNAGGSSGSGDKEELSGSAAGSDSAEAGPGEPQNLDGETGEGSEGGTQSEPPGVRLTETADAGRSYLDRFIFLGDSTTYGIGYYYEHGYSDELCPPSQVWTPASGTLTLSYYDTATVVYPATGEELSIVDAVTRAKPDIMLLTLGVNGVSFMDEEWFIRAYTELVQNIQNASPDTKIILNSIYPVMSTYQYIDQISNEKINAANGWIEQIAAGTGTRFLYSYEAVVGEDGTLPAANCNGDGIHLSGEGFTKVMHYIRTHEYV